jgi:translation elongation factor EF-4
MKLKDCGCGNIAQVTCEINDHSDFVIGCTVCDNRTPACESLMEAVSLWNQIYCYAFPAYEPEPV